jgi:hypothetical protein
VCEQRQRKIDDFFGRPLSKLNHNVVFERESYAIRFKVDEFKYRLYRLTCTAIVCEFDWSPGHAV